MPRRADIWRTGVIRAPIEQVLCHGLAHAEIGWLPEQPSFTFLADPFGWWVDGRLEIFVEAYDYRTRRGVIDVCTLDAGLTLVDRRRALTEPWHLSYPFVFEADGAQFMLPEAFRSGALTLYRRDGAADRWRAEARIALDVTPIDATPCFHAGRWWLFYAPDGTKHERISRLHVAWATRLQGPWTPHPRNPVRIDVASARPGGTPIVIGGRLMLPVQDCSRTYGGAIRPLWITRLDEHGFAAEPGEPIVAPSAAAPYVEGLHTLSACGPVTLVDVKRIDRSLGGLAIDTGRFIRRIFA